jgi:hypothetical protein
MGVVQEWKDIISLVFDFIPLKLLHVNLDYENCYMFGELA